MFKKYNLVGVLIFINLTTFCQTVAEVNAAFPDKEIVYLNFNQELALKIQDGIVVAQSNYARDLMILSKTNAAVYSRSKVYHSSFNELTNLTAYTKVPDGDKYKKVKIGEQVTSGSQRSGVFYDDSKETSFDFLGTVPNAVQCLQYSTFNKDAHLLSPFYLPSSVPIMAATYSVVVPNDITIKYVIKNDPTNQFIFTEEKKKKETVYTWTVSKYKGIDGYGNAPDNSYYDPHIIVYVTSYTSNGKTEPFLADVNDLFKWNTSFTKDINIAPDAAMQKIVDSLIAGKTTETQKAKSIYNWVQHNIKYIAFEAGLQGFKPRQAADVCNKRYGDCKDMSSIITTMLRLAKIKAYYTWIGTRDLPYRYSETPLPIVDNHMISTANINGEWVFFDGTDPHAEYGVPPAFIQTKEALVALSQTEYKILTVPTIDAQKNGVLDSTFLTINAEGVQGNQSVNYYGYMGEDNYNALLYRNEAETKDFVKTKMGKASNKFILGKYKITNTKPEENIMNISAAFTIPGYSKKIGNEYYINLNLEKLFENQSVDINKRKVAIEQDYNYTINQYHILQIPEGYTVSYLPPNFNFDNELLCLKLQYEVKNGTVIAYQQVTNKTLLIQPDKFVKWNDAAKAVAAQYKEQVVLEKK